MSLTGLFHPSGGPRYHLRALRHADGLWRPYRRAVAAWLDAWRPPGSRLLLLGPSAGYSLTRRFLERFSAISAVEPDPLARRLFGLRFPGLAVDWLPAGERLLAPLATHPDAAVLFCNLLGQAWRGAERDGVRRDTLAGLPARLAGRAWASYHDVVSTRRPPRLCGPLAHLRAPALEELLACFWPEGELELVDHDTHPLALGGPCAHVVWTLAPGRYHLVGWVRGGEA